MTQHTPPADYTRILTIDAESTTLSGKAFCLAMNVTTAAEDRTVTELDSVVLRCPMFGEPSDWVAANVLPGLADVPVNCRSYRDMLNQARRWQEAWRAQGVRVLTHIPWPVEAKLLSDMYPGEDIWQGPYPLLDVAPLLLVAGYEPESVDKFLREINFEVGGGHQPHHPLYDVRATAAAWWTLRRCFGKIL